MALDRILLAEPRGFCAGVERAVQVLGLHGVAELVGKSPDLAAETRAGDPGRDARLDPPEQVRGQGHETFARQPVADVAHDLVDAEDLLNGDDRRSAARRRQSQIAPHLCAVLFGSTSAGGQLR